MMQPQSLLSLLLSLVVVPLTTGLNILLTNEEGIDDIGLAKLRHALIKRGDDVHVFAPADDESGMGAALTMPEVKVEKKGSDEDKMWAVHGTASTAVLVGLAIMEHTPDLIISGVNTGYTSGPMDVHSSAVTSVMTGLGKHIPSFCITTNLSDKLDDKSHFADAAVFVAHLVDVLVEQIVVFPIGIGLKIGYPALRPKQIKKAVLAGNGHYNPFSYGYYLEDADTSTYKLGPAPSAQPFNATSDAVLVEEGNIAVLAISNDISLHYKDDNAYFLDDIGAVLAEVDARFSKEADLGFVMGNT